MLIWLWFHYQQICRHQASFYWKLVIIAFIVSLTTLAVWTYLFLKAIIWKCEFSWHGFLLQQILLDSSCLMLKFQSYFECFSSILSIELLELFSHIITFAKSPYQMQFPFHEIVHMWTYFVHFPTIRRILLWLDAHLLGIVWKRGSKKLGIWKKKKKKKKRKR